jgi:hypothetical protein
LPQHSRERTLKRRRPDEQQKLVVDGLSKLTEFGAKHEINIIVEKSRRPLPQTPRGWQA